MDNVREMTPDEKAIANKIRQKEYYIKNKARLIAYQMSYNKKNKQQTKITHKKYTDNLSGEKKQIRQNQLIAFREREKVKMRCDVCDCSFQRNSQWSHVRTEKHLRNIQK